MSKYIDYDAIDYRHYKLHDKSSEFLDGVIYMAERIENAPSIDIVRCKECRNLYIDTSDEGTSCYWCGVWANATDENGFCSHGKRKTEPQTDRFPCNNCKNHDECCTKEFECKYEPQTERSK